MAEEQGSSTNRDVDEKQGADRSDSAIDHAERKDSYEGASDQRKESDAATKERTRAGESHGNNVSVDFESVVEDKRTGQMIFFDRDRSLSNEAPEDTVATIAAFRELLTKAADTVGQPTQTTRFNFPNGSQIEFREEGPVVNRYVDENGTVWRRLSTIDESGVALWSAGEGIVQFAEVSFTEDGQISYELSTGRKGRADLGTLTVEDNQPETASSEAEIKAPETAVEVKDPNEQRTELPEGQQGNGSFIRRDQYGLVTEIVYPNGLSRRFSYQRNENGECEINHFTDTDGTTYMRSADGKEWTSRHGRDEVVADWQDVKVTQEGEFTFSRGLDDTYVVHTDGSRLTYVQIDGQMRLTAVEQPNGRCLEFEYTNGELTEIFDSLTDVSNRSKRSNAPWEEGDEDTDEARQDGPSRCYHMVKDPETGRWYRGERDSQYSEGEERHYLEYSIDHDEEGNIVLKEGERVRSVFKTGGSRLDYDENGRLAKIQYSNGKEFSFVYRTSEGGDDPDQLQEVILREGRSETRWVRGGDGMWQAFDDEGYPKRLSDGFDTCRSISVGGDGNIRFESAKGVEELIKPEGNSVITDKSGAVIYRNLAGRVTRVESPNQVSHDFIYDQDGRISEWTMTNPEGKKTWRQGQLRIEGQTWPEYEHLDVQRNGEIRLAFTKDSETSITYFLDGSKVDYGVEGKPRAIIDPAGAKTELIYDNWRQDNLTEVRNANGTSWRKSEDGRWYKYDGENKTDESLDSIIPYPNGSLLFSNAGRATLNLRDGTSWERGEDQNIWLEQGKDDELTGKVERNVAMINGLGEFEHRRQESTPPVEAADDAPLETARVSEGKHGVDRIDYPGGKSIVFNHTDEGTLFEIVLEHGDKYERWVREEVNGDLIWSAYDRDGNQLRNPDGSAKVLSSAWSWPLHPQYDGTVIYMKDRAFHRPDGTTDIYNDDLSHAVTDSSGRVNRITYPDGSPRVLEYDSSGDLIAVTAPDGTTLRRTGENTWQRYNSRGVSVGEPWEGSISPGDNGELIYRTKTGETDIYKTDGSIVKESEHQYKIVSPNGKTIELEFANGEVIRFKDNEGAIWVRSGEGKWHQLDDNGNPVQDESGSAKVFEFEVSRSENDNVVKTDTKTGHSFVYKRDGAVLELDEQNRACAMTSADGLTQVKVSYNDEFGGEMDSVEITVAGKTERWERTVMWRSGRDVQGKAFLGEWRSTSWDRQAESYRCGFDDQGNFQYSFLGRDGWDGTTIRTNGTREIPAGPGNYVEGADGRVLASKDSHGVLTTFSYDADGKVRSATRNGKVIWEADQEGAARVVKDGEGRFKLLDDYGRETTIHPDGGRDVRQVTMPGVEMFRRWGFEGTDAELNNLSTDAIRNYGKELLDNIGAHVAMYNALPPRLRAELASRGDSWGDGNRIDIRQVLAQMANGTLDESGHGFLRDFHQKLLEFQDRYTQRAESTSGTIEHLKERRRELVEELRRMTSQDYGFFDELAEGFDEHVRQKVDNWSIGGWEPFDGAASDDIPFEVQQHDLVVSIRDLDREIEKSLQESHEYQSYATHCELARDILEHERWMTRSAKEMAQSNNQAGVDYCKEKAARKALEMWEKYGDLLQQAAPSVWKQLSDWETLKKLDLTELDKMPNYKNGTEEALKAGLQGLKDAVEAGSADSGAIRQLALRAIASDPDLARLTDAASQFSQEFYVLRQMYVGGLPGDKFDSFVNDARARAARLREAMEKVDPEKIEEKIQQLRESLDGLDSKSCEEVTKQIEAYKTMLEMFKPGSDSNKMLTTMLDMIKSDQFDRDDVFKFMREDGPLMAVAIGAAVAVIVSCGTATPFAIGLGLALAPAAAIGASELTQYALYKADIGLGPGTKSRLHALIEDGYEVDPLTGQERELFWDDVALDYGKQYLMAVIIQAATLGAGHLISRGLSRGIRAFTRRLASMGDEGSGLLSRFSGRLQQMSTRLSQIDSAAASTGNRAFMRRFAGEFMDELGDELKEAAAQSALEKAFGKGNAVLGFIATVLVAGSKGINLDHISRVRGTNIIETNLPDAQMEILLEQMRLDGCRIETREGIHYVTTYEGDSLVLGRSTDIQRILPPAQATPDAEAGSHRSTDQRVGENDNTQLLESRERVAWDEYTWAPHEHSIESRKGIQSVTDALRAGDESGDYTAALDTVQDLLQAASDKHDVKIEPIDVNFKLSDLTNPDPEVRQKNLQALLAKMQQAGSITAGTDGTGGPTVNTSRLMIDMGNGVDVDLIEQMSAIDQKIKSNEALTVEERAIKEFLDSEAGQRLVQEQTLISLEELIHANQLSNDKVIISPTYAKFCQENGISGDELHSAFNGTRRSKASYEQEIIAILYDSGMSIQDIEHHFGNQYTAERAKIIDYLRQREGLPARQTGTELATTADVRAEANREPSTLGRDDTSHDPATYGDLFSQISDLETTLTQQGLDVDELQALNKILEATEYGSRLPSEFLGEQSAYLSELSRRVKAGELNQAQINEVLDRLQNNITYPNHSRDLTPIMLAFTSDGDRGRQNLEGLTKLQEGIPKVPDNPFRPVSGQMTYLGQPGWTVKMENGQPVMRNGNVVLVHTGEVRVHPSDVGKLRGDWAVVSKNSDGTYTMKLENATGMEVEARPIDVLLETVKAGDTGENTCAASVTALLDNLRSPEGIVKLLMDGDCMTPDQLQAQRIGQVGDGGAAVDHAALRGMVEHEGAFSLTEVAERDLHKLEPGIYLAVCQAAGSGQTGATSHTFLVTVDSSGRASMVDPATGAQRNPHLFEMQTLHRLGGDNAILAMRNLGLTRDSGVADSGDGKIRLGRDDAVETLKAMGYLDEVRSGDFDIFIHQSTNDIIAEYPGAASHPEVQSVAKDRITRELTENKSLFDRRFPHENEAHPLNRLIAISKQFGLEADPELKAALEARIKMELDANINLDSARKAWLSDLAKDLGLDSKLIDSITGHEFEPGKLPSNAEPKDVIKGIKQLDDYNYLEGSEAQLETVKKEASELHEHLNNARKQKGEADTERARLLTERRLVEEELSQPREDLAEKREPLEEHKAVLDDLIRELEKRSLEASQKIQDIERKLNEIKEKVKTCPTIEHIATAGTEPNRTFAVLIKPSNPGSHPEIRLIPEGSSNVNEGLRIVDESGDGIITEPDSKHHDDFLRHIVEKMDPDKIRQIADGTIQMRARGGDREVISPVAGAAGKFEVRFPSKLRTYFVIDRGEDGAITVRILERTSTDKEQKRKL